MTNEQLVFKIRNGFSVTDNMQSLYEKNLPLVRSFIKPYTAYESMEDLLQEAYFGLWEAVHHYETTENVLFMTYARFWIKQAVTRYIEKCGSVVKVPSHARKKMIRYKKTVHELEQELCRTPTDKEIADRVGISVRLLLELRAQMQGVVSLDTPITNDDNLTLADTIRDDYNLENEAIDKIYAEHSKNELWGIVEYYASIRESHIIKEYYLHNKSMPEIAREQGITTGRVREIKEKGLRRLRIGKARRILLEKFDIVEAGIYKSGFNIFNEHDFTSTVEYIAIRRAEIQAEYERRKKEIEDLFRKKMAVNGK